MACEDSKYRDRKRNVKVSDNEYYRDMKWNVTLSIFAIDILIIANSVFNAAVARHVDNNCPMEVQY